MTSSDKTKDTQDWPDPAHFNRSIRFQFSIYVATIVLILMAVTGYIISGQYVNRVTEDVIDKLLVQARSYSGPAGKLLIGGGGPDVLLLNNICTKLTKDNPDVFWAGITDQNDKFVAHSNIKEVIDGRRFDLPGSNQYGNLLQRGENLQMGKDSILLSISIDENDINLGHLAVGASTQPIKTARQTSQLTVVSITGLMILIGLPVTMILVRRKLQPIKVITQHLQRLDYSDIHLNIPVNGRNEFGYLAATVRVMGDKLNVAQQELLEKQRIAQELTIAREIQESILPKACPQSANFVIASTYSSAKEVGGDYYDFIDFDEREMGLLVADVSGKSLPGMLVMLLTRDIVRHLTRTIRAPQKVLTETNRELLKSIRKGMFVTMFYGLLDKETGKFTYASAGHNPLIHADATTGKCTELKSKGFPLGMMPDKVFGQRIETGEVQLSPGDWLVQYTDGINEALNEEEEEFGTQRLLKLMGQLKDLQPERFIQEFLAEHTRFVGKAEQYDDITLVAVKWLGRQADRKAEAQARLEHAV